MKEGKATVTVKTFIPFMLFLFLFFQTFIIGYPLFSLYVSDKHEGVIFLHLPMATDSMNGMYFTVEL